MMRIVAMVWSEEGLDACEIQETKWVKIVLGSVSLIKKSASKALLLKQVSIINAIMSFSETLLLLI